jgi:5-methylcytosine-specific restriction enzyme A
VVDHIKPHHGYWDLFISPDNVQSLCKPHHNSTKQREEKGGHLLGCDADGIPIDPQHHWR